jgi:RNA polymerase sigma factor (TIGR02999 family)
MSEATVMLEGIKQGGPKAAAKLLALVYEDLRRLADQKMAQEPPGHILQSTALVHEAWLRLTINGPPKFANRAHFFSIAAEAMRRILIERARRRQAVRHGGGHVRVDFEEALIANPADDAQILAVNDSIEKLAVEHPLHARVVKLRYFAGLSNEEISAAMNISVSTVKNYWTFSRAWLFDEITSK